MRPSRRKQPEYIALRGGGGPLLSLSLIRGWRELNIKKENINLKRKDLKRENLKENLKGNLRRDKFLHYIFNNFSIFR